MINRSCLLVVSIIAIGISSTQSIYALADAGKIIGQVIYRETNEPYFGSRVILEKNGKSVRLGAMSDMKGIFIIPNVPPDTYDLKITGPQFAPLIVKNLIVKPYSFIDLHEIQLIPYFPYSRGTLEIYDTTNSLSARSWFVRLEENPKGKAKFSHQNQIKLVKGIAGNLKSVYNIAFKKDSASARGVLQLMFQVSEKGNLEATYATFLSERWKICLLIKNFDTLKNGDFIIHLSQIIGKAMTEMKFDPIIQYEDSIYK